MSDTASPPSPTPPPKSNSKSKSKPTTSNVKAVKKKAFSCDQCRARKVRCGGEQPSCRRCVVRNDACRYLLAPTISYTQRLEERVRELEGVVEGLRNGNGNGEGEEEDGGVEVGGGGVGVSHDERRGLSAGPGAGAGGFDGLKRDEKGGITYHGATSFFQLPAPVGQSDGLGGGGVRSVLEAAGGGGERKERLVSNAWQQRAMETFSETPVSTCLKSLRRSETMSECKVVIISVGTLSVFVGGPLVLDPTTVQLRVQTGFHSYVCTLYFEFLC